MNNNSEGCWCIWGIKVVSCLGFSRTHHQISFESSTGLFSLRYFHTGSHSSPKPLTRTWSRERPERGGGREEGRRGEGEVRVMVSVGERYSVYVSVRLCLPACLPGSVFVRVCMHVCMSMSLCVRACVRECLPFEGAKPCRRSGKSS